MKAEENRKGSSKGAFAALDFSYDGRIPFWCKFIQVHDWQEQYAGEAGPERRREGKGDDGTVGGVTHASEGTLSVKMLRLEFLIAKPTLSVKPNLNVKLNLSVK